MTSTTRTETATTTETTYLVVAMYDHESIDGVGLAHVAIVLGRRPAGGRQAAEWVREYQGRILGDGGHQVVVATDDVVHVGDTVEVDAEGVATLDE